MSDKEIVGRRVFGHDYRVKQTTAKGRAGAFRLDVFIEDRPGNDLSVDRVGPRSVDVDVLRALLADCTKHARSFGKAFAGWASVTVAHIRGNPHNLEVKPTPKLGENDYHADILTAKMDVRERNKTAYFLAHLADFVSTVEPPWWRRLWLRVTAKFPVA